MAWETRPGSTRRYYYRCARIDGKVAKHYIGAAGDPVVRLVAGADELDEAGRSAAVEDVRGEQALYKALEPAFVAWIEHIRVLVKSRMLCRGYRHGRKGWSAMRAQPRQSTGSSQNEQDRRPTRELLEHLVRQANRGDQDALATLRRTLEENRDILDAIADLTGHIENSLIGLICRENLVLSEALRLRVGALRRRLRDEGEETTVEALLVDQVVLTWLDVRLVAMAAIQPQQHRGDARFWGQRYDRASRRHAKAIEELVTVRGLLEKNAPPTHPLRRSTEAKADGDADSTASFQVSCIPATQPDERHEVTGDSVREEASHGSGRMPAPER